MIRSDAIELRLASIFCARAVNPPPVDQRHEKIGIEIRNLALAARPRRARAPCPYRPKASAAGLSLPVSVAIELHEHEIPDFDVAPAVAAEFAIRVPLIGSSRAHVVENFRARPARTGIAHRPEIFFQPGNRDHAIFRRADLAPTALPLRYRVSSFLPGANFRAAENREVEFLHRNRVPIFAA